LLQAAVLVPQLLHLADLVGLQADVLLLPAIERLFADPRLAVHSATETPISAFKIPTICSTEKRFFLSQSSVFAGAVLVED
jgi:hypothetical protein